MSQRPSNPPMIVGTVSRPTRLEAEYPACFGDLPDPPDTVWMAGRRPRQPAVAIVGTRAASTQALEFAHDLAADLACHGVGVVSGGARGIDTAAHQGALGVSGPSWAVLATGLENAYPPENKSLFEDLVASGGGLISAASPAAAPHRGRFLRRNRLIAALAQAVVVVQAPYRSGALSTAHWAKRLKRMVFCVPGSVWDPRFAGSNALLAQGARVCTCAADILSVRPYDVAGASPGAVDIREDSSDFDDLDEVCKRVLGRLTEGVRDPDRIATTLDIRINRVHESLLTLELSGFIHRRQDGGYGVTSRRASQVSATRTATKHGSDHQQGFPDGDGDPRSQ